MVKVHRIPVLQDNYSYLVEAPGSAQAIIIDPGQAEPILEALERLGLQPVALWNTHHHDDHIAGNSALLQRFPQMPVVGSLGDKERIAELTQWVSAGDTLEFGGEQVQVLAIPGHTLGHIAFYFPSGHLFSGDLLFGYSCGAVFEGTMEQMYHSVSQLLELPDEVLIYCGHEYTLNNCRWALHVDPDNSAIQERIQQERPPTVPLRLGLEKQTNHFLRCHLPQAQAFTGLSQPAEVFGALRIHKNSFK